MKWHCAVALLKALTTYTIHSATETYKNYANENITSFMHKRTNNLLKIIIVPWTSPSDAIFANVKSAGSRHGKTGAPVLAGDKLRCMIWSQPVGRRKRMSDRVWLAWSIKNKKEHISKTGRASFRNFQAMRYDLVTSSRNFEALRVSLLVFIEG